MREARDSLKFNRLPMTEVGRGWSTEEAPPVPGTEPVIQLLLSLVFEAKWVSTTSRIDITRTGYDMSLLGGLLDQALASLLDTGHLLRMFVEVRESTIHGCDIQLIPVSEGSRVQTQPLDLFPDEEDADPSTFDPGVTSEDFGGFHDPRRLPSGHLLDL